MVVDRRRGGPAREKVLQAAERVITEIGAARLTLDGVAHEAGVSKGGLLYHFPSKEALLGALAQRYVASVDRCVREAKDGLSQGRSRDLKAFVLGMLTSNSRDLSMGAMLVASAANDLKSLKLLRAHGADYAARINDTSAGSPRAAIVSLAIEGLKMREALEFSPFTRAQREKIVQELLQIADEAYQ